MKIQISKTNAGLTVAAIAVVALLTVGFWTLLFMVIYAFSILLAYQMGRMALSSQEDFESEKIIDQIIDFYRLTGENFAQGVITCGIVYISLSVYSLYFRGASFIDLPFYAVAVFFVILMVRIFSIKD